MAKNYDKQGNITDAHKLAVTGSTNSGRNNLQQQVIEAVTLAKELDLINQLAEHSNTTPDRIERISKGKIPNNENILAKIVVAWNKIKTQEADSGNFLKPQHESSAIDELNLAHA